MNDDSYYLDICKVMLRKSSCLFCKCAAMIVDSNGEIIGAGYSHPIDSSYDCQNNGICSHYRATGKYPHLGNQNECVSLHAEIFAILSADRNRLKGSTMYIAAYDLVRKQYKTIVPDRIVAHIIQASGIKRICSLQGEEYQVLGHLFNEEK